MTTDADGRLVAALLLETAPDGAFAKLEAASAVGLLTLHPDGSGLHGNVVRQAGIEHVTLPWPAGHVVLVAGSPLTAAAAAAHLVRGVGVGEGRAIGVLEVGADLAVRLATWRVARVTADRWWFTPAEGGDPIAVTLDSSGIPLFDAGSSWPLELDHDRGDAANGERTVDGMWTTVGEAGPNSETRG